MSKAQTELCGVTGKPIPATGVLVKSFEGNFNTKVNQSLIILNEQEGTFTAANSYDGNLGTGYDPSKVTYPITAKSRKKWAKSGYVPGKVEDYGFLTNIGKVAATAAK